MRDRTPCVCDRLRNRFLRIIVSCIMLGPALALAAQDSSPSDLNFSLLQAIANRDVAALHRLVSEGANIDARNSNGETPLMAAAENSNVEALKFLLEKGANVAAQDNQHETALIHAARAFDPEVLEILLPKVSDYKEKNKALIRAAAGGPVVVRLPDSEAGRSDASPASEAAELPWVRSVRLLLDSGADIEARDEEGTTPLLQAAIYAQTEIFEFLLKRGANIGARDKRGSTALMDAACNCAEATMNSAYDIVKILLDLGVDVNARDHDGRTALMVASGMVGDVSVYQLLLNRGANPLLKDNKGETALKIALQGRRDDKIQLVKQAIARAR